MHHSVLLCGHTGSMNRGCEAILRSTGTVLNAVGVSQVTAMTFDRSYDTQLGLDQAIQLVDYPSKTFLQRAQSLLRRKIWNDHDWGNRILYRQILDELPSDCVTFNVGGDTYCYGEPYLSYTLNKMTREKNVKNVFWGCSVDEHALNSTAMQEDINRYRWIVVRESLSEEILRKVVKEQDKIIRSCDPAFQLEMQPATLPKGFVEGNTLGLNLSPLVFGNVNDPNDLMRQNVTKLITWVLEETDLHICLIPHVYRVSDAAQDLGVLQTIYQQFGHTGRVSIVDEELSCTQLKYIIARCRFFVGARTHSTIAAYSTAVPTIAISYSIKSRGIARDLFGTEQGYAIPWKKLTDTTQLQRVFVSCLWEQEEKLKAHYARVLPAYKESVLQAAKHIVES